LTAHLEIASALVLVGCASAAGFLLAALAAWVPIRIQEEEDCWVSQLNNPQQEPRQPISFSAYLLKHRWFSADAIVLVTLGILLALLILLRVGASPLAWALLVFSLVFLAAALVDFRAQLLPDLFTQPMVWLGLLVQLHPLTRTVGIELAVLGAVAGYVFFWLVGSIFFLVRKQEGLGQGDMKLIAAAGAWFGPMALAPILAASALVGAAWQLIAIKRGKSKSSEHFPFGPFIVLGSLIWLIWQAPVWPIR
jgi:prepilin signal peptidase PulO-like enzyme (type II secretory pathway)